MRRAAHVHNSGGSPQQSPRTEYLEQTAHSVEVRRETNEKGELGSYGFILVQERPPIVGTIVPGECVSTCVECVALCVGLRLN